MNPDEILAKLAEALGIAPGGSPEDTIQQIESFLEELETEEEGGELDGLKAALDLPPETAATDVAGKIRAMAQPKTAAPVVPPPQPVPAGVPQQMPPARKINFDSLKALHAIAGKSNAYAPDMPFMVQPNQSGGKVRDYSTKGVAYNRGAKAPGIMELVNAVRSGDRSGGKAAKAMSYGFGPTGGFVLNQEVSDQIIDPLVAQEVVLAAGAQQENMDGTETLVIPRMKTIPTAYWPGEGQAVTDSQPSYGTITLVPKPIAVLVKRPYKFFNNMTPKAETQLREYIVRALRLEMDKQFLLGDGGADATNTGAKPLGLLNISGVTSTSLGTNGGTPTLANLVALDGALDDANIEEGGERAYIFHSRTKRVFTGMTDTLGRPLLRDSWGAKEERALLGYPFFVSTQIPITKTVGSATDCSYLFYGDWQYAVVGISNQVEIVVLNELYANTLTQGLLCYAYVDFNVHHSEAFQVLTGVRWA